MEITDKQREMLRSSVPCYRSARRPPLTTLLIIEMGAGGTIVRLEELQSLSRLLGTDDIYVETNELEDAPSCTIFCNNVSGEWNPLEPEQRKSKVDDALGVAAHRLNEALNLMGEDPRRQSVFDAMRLIVNKCCKELA